VAPRDPGDDLDQDLGPLVRGSWSACSAASIARLVSSAPPFATRSTTSPEYGERTSIQSPVSIQSPATKSFRSATVVATAQV
jgi:hypothetical protein